MNDKLYWVWLSQLFACGSQRPSQLLALCESPEDLYHLSEEELASFGVLTSAEIKAMKAVSLERARLILEKCEKCGIRILCWADEDFPKRLRLIYGPPVVLYVKGSLAGLDSEVVITVVGTRRATDYSDYATQFLCRQLAAAGAVIVSGCAVGIDAAAHLGALAVKGRTVAVLGCGLDVDYPRENAGLKQQILERGGALVSELPPGTQPIPRMFPVRNRLMAGLALGVLVTHAPERSGSLITAEHALEQGKEVFCLPPYSIFDTSFAGVIRYLRDGAIPVFCAEDVLGMYTGAYADRLDVTQLSGDYAVKKDPPEKPKIHARAGLSATAPPAETVSAEKENLVGIVSGFDEKQLTVYNNLELDPKHLDELQAACGLPIGELLSILTELEILGLAASLGGRRYALAAR